MLEVQSLRKSFGDLVAVDDVSFSIAAGETFGLLGPNGAGKTTAISMICGLIEPDRGRVEVSGERVTVGTTSGRVHIGYVPQELAIYPDMTARQNLRFFARLYGLAGDERSRRIDEVLEIVGLTDRADDLAKEYSGGMQRRLNIAAGMIHTPSLLVLDEPTVGIDPQSRNAILDAVATLGAEGMAVLYTTHYMEEAERLCDRVAIMDRGSLRAIGTRRELIDIVGEHDVVRMHVVAGAGRAAEVLTAQPEVVRATASPDGNVECVVDDSAGVLAGLMAALAAAEIAIQRVEVHEPSLDAVFLHLTGTGLRDSA